ncbi:hypothetical protein FRB99_006535, partial [Tulasnella sp. 403]
MADDGPVVEFSALEREKENITVNRDGHSAVALQQTFSVPRNQRQQQLAAEKARFTQLIKDAHDDSPDPLDAYVQFVKWTIDSYPAGKSADSGLVPLLELATRTFKDDPSYKLDLRYLNLWLQYANVVAKPELIYAYLLANDIGHCFAVLYEEYANVLERQGSQGESQYAMNEWTKLDSQAAIDKENHSEPTPWTGERLHQAVPKTPRTPRFTVLKDMDSADLAKPIPHKTPDTMVIRPPTQRPPTEAEMLFLDPFKNYTHPPSQPSDVSTKPAVFQPSVPEPSTSKAGVASSSKAPSHSAPPTTRPSASDPSKYPKPRAFIPHEELPGQAPRRPEKLGFNFKLLWNEADQKEFCAYEARAKTLGLLYKKWPAPEILTQGHVSFQLPKTGEGSRKNRMSVAREPTVTINTKFAMNDVLDMFNGMDGEEEDSFEDDGGGNAGPSGGAAQGLATAPAQIPPTPTPLSRATSASLVDKTPISKPKVSQTPKFTPFVDAADDGATKPGVSSLAGVGHPSSHTPGPLGRSVSVPSVLGQSTTRTPRFTPFVDPPSATPRPPLVAKTPSALSSATPLGPPPTVAPPEGAPEPTPLRPRPGPSFRPFVDSGGDVPPTPTPLSSTRTTDEPLDLPSSIREEEMSGEGQTSGSGSVGLKSFGIFRDVSPKQNDPIVQHTSPKVQTSPQPPFSIDNIFSSSTSGIFDNVKDEPAKEPSEQQSFPLINFVPSPENTQEHTQPVVPPRAYEDDLKLRRFGAKKQRTSSQNRRTSASVETLSLTLAEDKFEIYEKLGEGGFGAVFLARCGGGATDEVDEDAFLALKAVKPCQLWEWTILVRLRECMPPETLPSIITPQALYAFSDESYLLLDHCRHGTLLDCVNKASGTDLSSATGDGLVEPLVVFFTIELFKLVEHLHINGFIHGDLKIDNCLVRLEDVPGAAWSTQYDPTGANGWAQQGVRLIDFGRAIDTTLFPEDQVYVGDWPTDARDCVEMREGRPWTFETDYFGLAGIVFCMLFKKYIDTAPITAPDGSTRYKLATPLKRYWNTPLWTRVFDVLLNPKLVRPDGSLPIVDELTILRDEMEHWLVQNSAKSGKSLK